MTTHSCTDSLTLYLASLVNKILWSTVSKAFWRSRKSTPHTPIVNVVKQIGQKVNEACDSGVAPREPRLALVEDMVARTVAIQLIVNGPFHQLSNTWQY